MDSKFINTKKFLFLYCLFLIIGTFLWIFLWTILAGIIALLELNSRQEIPFFNQIGFGLYGAPILFSTLLVVSLTQNRNIILKFFLISLVIVSAILLTIYKISIMNARIY